MAGTVDNEDRVTAAAAMYDNEASAEEDVMGGSGSCGCGGQGLDENDDGNNGNGSSNDKR